VVIGRGKLIAQCTTEEFVERAGSAVIRVRSPQLDQLSALLTGAGAAVRPDTDSERRHTLLVSGIETSAIGELAATNSVVLHELSPMTGSLEEAFMQLTGDSVDYHTQSAAG
jgi:ABC-2 type transport system ATP-binding protein